MHHVGAGEAERHWRLHRNFDAMRYKVVLLGNEPHGGGAVGLDGRPQITLDELALKVKRPGIDDFDVARRVQSVGDSGSDDHHHHNDEH